MRVKRERIDHCYFFSSVCPTSSGPADLTCLQNSLTNVQGCLVELTVSISDIHYIVHPIESTTYQVS